MSSEMRELVRAKIHEWRTDALEIRESDHAHRNLIAEEYEAHADELEAMLAKKPAPISGGAVINDAMVSAAYDHLCEAGVIKDAGTVAADMKVMRQALERALLDRTEAGPSLLCQSDACAHKGTAHNFCTPRTEAGADGVVAWMREGATTVMHNFRFDKPQAGPWIPLYTHPQDVSGDAVDWKWQYRFQTVMRFMDNGATREAAERAALIDIAALESAAMQAKEAK